MQTLNDLLDATPFAGLAVTTCHTGYNASVQFDEDHWSPTVFGTCASEAIAKALALRPVPVADVAPVLAPPPY